MPLTFLVTSPRVAPGLMSWAGWQSVAAADRVLCSDATAPVFRAVVAAGHRVDVLPSPTAEDLLALGADAEVVWLADDQEAVSFPGALATQIVGGAATEVEVLHASYDVPGARLLDLVTVMDRLRTSCPWDREQTHESLAKYLLEEAYETLEAIESGDPVHLREELGDLLLQVYFHARIASESPGSAAGEAGGLAGGGGEGVAGGGFTIDDVAGGIVDKLVHRHPHVFAGLEVEDADEVERNWETLKAAEKGRGSVLDGVPLSLPALALADKVLGRAARVGVAAPDPDQPAGTASAEAVPADAAGASGGATLGDTLLALVGDARAAGLDAEQELRAAVRRLADAVRAAEAAGDA